jgi:Bacteriocin-protection, YdeI or OmpD-Associated/Domain of unknown function (DUF1905)
MKIRAVIELGGKTATGFEVPAEVVEALGAGKRPPVRVTINGFTYRSTVAVMGGRYMVGVSAENRAGTGVAAGDEVDIELELDSQPRELAIPADFQRALDGNPAARKKFEALSYSAKQRYVLPMEAAKTPKTRQRRIDGALAELGG